MVAIQCSECFTPSSGLEGRSADEGKEEKEVTKR